MIEFWVGVIGTVVGAAVTLASQWAKHCWETHQHRQRDKNRKAMLTEMLNSASPTGWRKMETLSRVIGADRDETALLLIDIGARGSETGNDVWAWQKDHPLPQGD